MDDKRNCSLTPIEQAERENERLVARRFGLMLQINAMERENRRLDEEIKVEQEKEKKQQDKERKAAAPSQSHPSSGSLIKCFVGSLHLNAKESDIKNYFISHGEVVSVDLKRDSKTGESKRYAFLTFSSLKDSTESLFTKKHFILNKKIFIEPQKIQKNLRENPKPKTSSPQKHRNCSSRTSVPR